MPIFQSVKKINSQNAWDSPMTTKITRLAVHLVVCLLLTFPVGAVLARYAVPKILLLSITGDPLGFAGTVLLLLWVLSLLDLWQHVYWDICQFRSFRGMEDRVAEQPIAETHSEI